MFIPLKTDRYSRRTPVVTQGIIIVNMVVYLLMYAAHYFDWFTMEQVMDFGAVGRSNAFHDFYIWQLLTSQFLHSPNDLLHLGFNMWFLWVFAVPLEDRLKHWNFLTFYLMGGIMAAIGHMVFSQAPAIGASGAVCAVTGGYLAMFPRSRILTWAFIWIVWLQSLWLIGLFFALDLANQVWGMLGNRTNNVAYAAHLIGYLYGFFLIFTLLAVNIVKRGDADVFSLLKQARRRAEFRAAARQNFGATWDTPNQQAGDTLRQRDRKKKKKQRTLTADEAAYAEQRAEIHRFAAKGELAKAAEQYRDVLADNPDSVLAERAQLDIANYLFQHQQHEVAAQAYELFLSAYRTSSQRHDVQLLLALLYIRELDQPQRGRELLEEVTPSLRQSEQRELAAELMDEAES